MVALLFVQSVALLSTVMYGESMQKQWLTSVSPQRRSSDLVRISLFHYFPFVIQAATQVLLRLAGTRSESHDSAPRQAMCFDVQGLQPALL